MDWDTLQHNICSLDLEADEHGEIIALGAVFRDRTFLRRSPFDIRQVLAELDAFAGEAEFVLGHNILLHDLPLCRAVDPRLDLYAKPVIDTLFLSPLAFPENPYHRLVKNYKLVRDSLNDPLADAKLALSLFQDQFQALREQHADTELLSFYHYAFAENPRYDGLQRAFSAMGADTLKAAAAFDLLKALTEDRVCRTAFNKVILAYLPNPELRPALAYCLAWLRVAGGNSVLPPWVRRQFDRVAPALRQLRDIPCQSPDCRYCRQVHDPVGQLQRYFGFSAFRPQPENDEGGSLQQDIVQAGMADTPMFAVLPTGGGKSLCYQLPALARYQRRGVLTIVISPLQALMKDQVDNLRNKTGAPNVAALYGMLTGPERGEVLKAIQLGDIALLYVSPEQLRNVGFQNAIEHREIGCWVFDEAHCLSKWGHDFRPDYLYVGRFIKEFAAKQQALLPPVQCFTATAKQDVKDEIIDYFRANLGQELAVFEGGVERDNLHFEVQTVGSVDKYPRINTLLHEHLDGLESGSAIIYCATRAKTEELAEFLQQQDWRVEAFHAAKNAAEKKHIQDNFITGSTRVITATNAFGMGIDKEDVRLVIHADIPGSLENYLQEAGRAGRDQQDAECILLFDENDIDTQFKLSASSQLNQRDIAQILKGLRRVRKDRSGNVVITTGELLQHDEVETSFDAEDYNAATKVITAVSWLERSGFIERNENKTQVFQGRPLVKNREEAEQKIAQLDLSARQQKRWLAILDALFNADGDEGFSADELALSGEFAPTDDEEQRISASQRVIRTLYQMSELGLIQKNLLLTAFVRYKVANASAGLLQQICRLEQALIEVLQEQAPDAEEGDWQALSLRHVNQRMLDLGFSECNPEVLRLLLVSMSRDGQGLAGNKGSLTLRHSSQDQYRVKLNRGWQALMGTVQRRQGVAQIALNAMLAKIPPATKPSADLLVEFAVEDLLAALKQDIEMNSAVNDPLAAVERGLNFLHEQKVITLQKGLAVFRQAMTIKVLPESKGRRYNKGDYEPLSQHYGERIFQVHVMNEYARKGMEKIGQALAFVVAYFSQDKTEFVKRYFKGRREILERATSQQSFQRIVSDLQNPQQQALVAADEDDNQLILAGPGSGKTRVVIHRCAYLLRVRQAPASSILVLCFNRNAAAELRQRLFDLVGADAKAVTIQTYHGLSLRLTGHALTGIDGGDPEQSEQQFQTMIKQAIDLLNGDTPCLNVDGDEMRDRLLAGYRHILVDEYQDIDQLQYRLISALAGRNRDEDSKLTILAVGDDDQNIYQFRGANIGFIRQFEEDYRATQHYLVENYRSSAHIIAAANQLIEANRDRMKQRHPIRINQGRKTLPAGGRWEKLDPLAKGRVQILECPDQSRQARVLVQELLRLRQLNPSLDWSQCAILTTEWRLLNPVRACLEAQAIPLSLALPKQALPPPFRIRENLELLNAIKQSSERLCKASEWLDYLTAKPDNIWTKQLQKLLQSWRDESGDAETGKQSLLEYLYESLGEQRRDCRLGQGVFLSTIHSVKGMEFSHGFILDGGWSATASEEQRRLLYVAMTRARETLCLLHSQDSPNPYLPALQGDFILRRAVEHQNEELAGQADKSYEFLGLQDLDLSYAGSFAERHPIHRALAALDVGSVVSLCRQGDKIVVVSDQTAVAVLSKKARQLWWDRVDRVRSAAVIAMITRYRSDNEEAYQSRCKVDKWEVPMLEVLIHDAVAIDHSEQAGRLILS
ncbi:RecQ family ATP-dependent DNA helicase [Methylomarinum sp. Ch1-1]|uniref:DNA 3'-5' helicase n=1 Tax=Methylomarinum roseum TaxID=3067653 RepID=A0AAU7NQJ2_9GAMM|nr:RecQ family ATP-dependent DNA helicase [Methylomarinum sp. Ch1-1]MDP4520837.1 RecQ family ATP-dependent DNA helicase [Methylomarinum sp. Ch1-1]